MRINSIHSLFLLLITTHNAVLLGQSAGTFTATGTMTTPRVWHTATLLSDGRVLIAGGVAVAGAALASAEIYDPSTGTFTATRNLTFARSEHTAILLPNGNVLIAGGDGTPGSAELFDPASGTFAATGNMIPDGSYKHTATLLPDGRVLFVADGYYGSGAQIYDPSTGVFTSTGSPFAAPDGPNTATSLPDGTALITQSSELEAEVYDPRTGAFHRTMPRYQVTLGAAAMLLNGQVLFAGGNNFLGESAAALVYDSKTASFGRSGDLTQQRSDHTATLLPDGEVLIAGGDLGGDIVFTLSTAELYDPGAGRFMRTGIMTANRSLHTATLLNNGKVLITGGSLDTTHGWTPLDNAELYTPDSLIAAPILLSLSGDGKGAGAIWHSTAGAVVSASNPAIAGEALSMYTTNLAKDGVIPPQVIVGDQPAQVLYFGAAPGYPGYFQVNFLVPPAGMHGPGVPIVLRYLDRSSNEVTISMR